MIRKGTYGDIDAILKITQACTDDMVSKNIFQWNVHYPNIKVFKQDIERGELFIIQKSYAIVGCITISTYMDEVYKPVTWLTATKKNIYIHRLAVHPQFQRKGFAQELMQFAERYAMDKEYTSVRLDTFSQNERNQTFYERRGYHKLGAIYFPKQSEHPFYCYELVL